MSIWGYPRFLGSLVVLYFCYLLWQQKYEYLAPVGIGIFLYAVYLFVSDHIKGGMLISTWIVGTLLLIAGLIPSLVKHGWMGEGILQSSIYLFSLLFFGGLAFIGSFTTA